MMPEALNEVPLDHNMEIRRLSRQVRQLQIALLGLVAAGLVAASAGPARVLHAERLVLADEQGRPRIVLSAAGGTPTIDFRGDRGARRLLLGEEPNPVVNGKTLPRIAPAWGLLIFNPKGAERGGMSYLDNGRSVISLDRPNTEGVYMTVNEQSGFAGLVGNYETGGAGQYEEAFRLGTLHDHVFAQASNRDGSPAGAVVGGKAGQLRRTDAVQR